MAAPWAPQPQLHLLWDSQLPYAANYRVLIASMAETYARMDKSSADGMKTADAAVAAVVEGWARVRDDSSSVEWVVYALDGKTYKLAAEGSGRPELLNALDEASSTFAAFSTVRRMRGSSTTSSTSARRWGLSRKTRHSCKKTLYSTRCLARPARSSSLQTPRRRSGSRSCSCNVVSYEFQDAITSHGPGCCAREVS